MEQEETETEEEAQEAVPKRILNWLLRAKWLRKVEDYTTMTTNIVIPVRGRFYQRVRISWSTSLWRIPIFIFRTCMPLFFPSKMIPE